MAQLLFYDEINVAGEPISLLVDRGMQQRQWSARTDKWGNQSVTDENNNGQALRQLAADARCRLLINSPINQQVLVLTLQPITRHEITLVDVRFSVLHVLFHVIDRPMCIMYGTISSATAEKRCVSYMHFVAADYYP